MPFIISNALRINIELVDITAEGGYSIFLIKPFETTECATSIVRKGDHFDALIPIESLKVDNLSLENEDDDDSIVISDSNDSSSSPASLLKCDSGVSLLSPLPFDMIPENCQLLRKTLQIWELSTTEDVCSTVSPHEPTNRP